jgi:hypothetical protein
MILLTWCRKFGRLKAPMTMQLMCGSLKLDFFERKPRAGAKIGKLKLEGARQILSWS